MRVAEYVRINLLSSMGVFKLKNVNITERVNGGVNWSCSLVDHTLIDPLSISESESFTINIETLSDSYTSPPLIVENPSRRSNLSGRPGTLSGIDMTTWLMSRDDLSFNTFINSNSKTICELAAGAVGISIFGLKTLPVPEDDIKGVKPWDVINRYLKYLGQNWLIRPDGAIQCFDVTYMGPLNDSLRYSDFGDSLSHASRVDSMKIEKTSRVSGDGEVCFQFDSEGFKTVQLPQPLHRPAPTDRSTYGRVQLITFFNGSTAGPVVALYPMRDDVIITPGSIDMSLPATHFTCVVLRPLTLIGNTPISAKICVTGNPFDPTPPNQPITVQPAFRRQIGSGSRPRKDIWTDTIIPNPQWVTDNAWSYMIEENKNYHPISGDGPLNLTAYLCQTFTSPGFPIGRIEQFSHNIDISSNTAKTSVSGFVPWPTSPPVVTTF